MISPASLQTSVPDPIENPTSAAFKAGASFVPSPVIPTQRPISCASLTILSFVFGVALAITLIYGSFSFASSSDKASKSIADIAISESLVISPASLAIALAVSMTSPVTIITCTPASCIFATASGTSGRTSSRIATKETRTKSSGNPSSGNTDLLYPVAITLIAFVAYDLTISFNFSFSIGLIPSVVS